MYTIRIPRADLIPKISFSIFMFVTFFGTSVPSFQSALQEQGVDEIGNELELNSFYKYMSLLYENEKQQAYSSAKLLVLPSDWDAYSLVLLEALARKLPIVSTYTRGAKDIIDGNKNGFISKKGEVDALSERVVRILKDDKLQVELSKNAYQKAVNHCSAESITKTIASIYQNILNKRN